MSQFARMWTSSRHPARGCDELRTVVASDDVLVICRGRCFLVQSTDAGGKLLSAAALREQFERCVGSAHADGAVVSGESVGALTAGDRERWAIARQCLLGDHANRAALDAIERAFFVVCIDDEAPASDDEAAALGLAGDGRNR